MKTCANCGGTNLDDAQFCQTCERSLAAAEAVPLAPSMLGQTGPPQSSPISPAAPQPPAGPPPLNSGMAIASLVCGMLILLLPLAIVVSRKAGLPDTLAEGLFALAPVVAIPAAITAIVLGHLSRAKIRRSAGRLKGDRMALEGIILGYAYISILIIAAIAIPNLLRSRIVANEASAVGSLRALNTAAVTFSTQCGGFPVGDMLTFLGPPANGCVTADLIDSVLALGIKNGYVFVASGVDADGDGRGDTYTITATPSNVGSTGQRQFYTDQAGVIRVEMNQPASADSPPIS